MENKILESWTEMIANQEASWRGAKRTMYRLRHSTTVVKKLRKLLK